MRSCLLLSLAAMCLTGCGSTGRLTPAEQLGKSERERELLVAERQPLGAVSATWMKATWQMDDLADRVSGKPARLVAELEQTRVPDERRRGMSGLADRPWGQKPPYTTRYAQIAADPSNDFLLRAMAIRSLNRSREPGHTKLFVDGLSDPNEQVRLESAKALNRMPDPDAAGALLNVAKRPDETRDVRIAAIDALKYYKRLEVARQLVSLLNDRDFSMAWQARRSLRDLTQKDLGYSESAWLSFLTGPDKPNLEL